MRIVCPACETGYQVANGTLGATGRKVRCARCGTVWHASPDDFPEAGSSAATAAPATAITSEPSEDEWRDAIAGDGPDSKFDAGATVPPAKAADAANDQSSIDDMFATAGDTPNDQSSIDDMFATAGDTPNDQSSIDDMFSTAGDTPNDQSSVDDMFATAGDTPNDQSSIDDLFSTEGDGEPEATVEQATAVDAAASADAAPTDVAPTIDAPPTGFEPARRNTKSRRAKGGRAGVSAMKALDKQLSTPVASSLLIGTLVLFLAGAVVGRQAVVAAFPDFAGIYELIGLKVNLRGLDFDGVSSRREMDGSTPVLVVEGDIINIDTMSKPLPAVRITLRSSTGRDVYAWNYVVPQINIDQLGKLHFKTRLLAPPEAAVAVEVRFTDQHSP